MLVVNLTCVGIGNNTLIYLYLANRWRTPLVPHKTTQTEHAF